MVDGTKYALTLVRDGKEVKAACYGDQDKAYENLIQFLRRINHQEWLLYQLQPDGKYRSDPDHAIGNELDAALGKPGRAMPYAPVLDFHRFVPAYAAKLATSAKRSSDELVTAAKLMGYLRVESQFKSLQALAADSEIGQSAARQEAVWALSRLGGEKSIEALLAMADDPDHWVRDSLAEALLKLQGAKAIPVLTTLAGKNRNAAWALIRLGPAAVETIVDVIEREHDRTDRSDCHLFREYFEHWKDIPQPVDRRVIDAIYERIALNREDDYALKVLELAGRPYKVLSPRQTLEGFLATLVSGDEKAIGKATSFHFRGKRPPDFLGDAEAGKLKIVSVHTEKYSAWARVVDRTAPGRCYFVWMGQLNGRAWGVTAAMPQTRAKLDARLKQTLKEHPNAREVPAAAPATRPAAAGGSAKIRNVADVLASFKAELVGMSARYPALAGAKDIPVGPTSVVYSRNCGFAGKRGYVDTGPQAVAVGIKTMTVPRFLEQVEKVAMQAPSYRWNKLALVGWLECHFGKDVPPALSAELNDLLTKHVKMIDALDRRAGE